MAVLGSQTATDLFGDPADGGTDPIGQTIRIKSSKFTVDRGDRRPKAASARKTPTTPSTCR